MCQYPGSWIPMIQGPRCLRILDLIFSFSWDFGDLGSCHGSIAVGSYGFWISDRFFLLDPVDPGSSFGKLSWDLANLGFYTAIMSLYLEDPLHPIEFCLGFPISICCLNLSTIKIFNLILIQPFCVDLKTSSPGWFLHMFSVMDVLLTGCDREEMNARFITS